MSLFNFGECNMCKRRRCNKKLALCNVLPANVCNMIGEYVNDCWRSEWIKENEKHFFKGFTGENNDVNKASNQLIFFRMFKMPLLSTLHRIDDTINETKYKKEIDRIFNKQSVKNKYVYNKMDLQAIKSFCKKDSNRIKLIVWCCHSKEEMDSIFNPFFYSNNNTFTFRNREYLVSNLAKLFLIEYIDDLIGDDKVYCDMDGIREHIDNLFQR